MQEITTSICKNKPLKWTTHSFRVIEKLAYVLIKRQLRNKFLILINQITSKQRAAKCS